MTAIVGNPPYQYEVPVRWETLPENWSFVEVAGVATDAFDRVYVFNRGEHPVIVFDRKGAFLNAWGEGLFVRPHGIRIAPDGSIFLVDDADHTVRKYSPEGELLLKLGTSGKGSDTGATSTDFRTIVRVGAPFHYPTNLAVAPNGDLYIADGYGNARIHRFTADGKLLHSWGEPGAGPGQFHVPHGIAIDRSGTVFVADRENSRVQLFDLDGKFLAEWREIARPCQVAIGPDNEVYIAELGYRAGMWPGTSAPTPDATGGRVSVFSSEGALLSRWGGGNDPCAPGDFFAPHDICIDSHGDLYVGEVMMSAGGRRGLVPHSCHSLQKFVRRK